MTTLSKLIYGLETFPNEITAYTCKNRQAFSKIHMKM